MLSFILKNQFAKLSTRGGIRIPNPFVRSEVRYPFAPRGQKITYTNVPLFIQLQVHHYYIWTYMRVLYQNTGTGPSTRVLVLIVYLNVLTKDIWV